LGKNGVPVLALTTRLLSNPTRRVVETAQMLVDVMQAGGLTEPYGRGRRTISKVRLMHGAIRKLAPTAPNWKPEYGLPVNQEDLAGTLMSFSWVAIDGLQKLGFALSDSEQEAYLHCWQVVGSLLGILPEAIPPDISAAQRLTKGIADHQFGASPYGQEMTRALLEMLAGLLPGHALCHTPALLMRYLLGQQWAEWLGVEDSKIAELCAAPIQSLGMNIETVLHDCNAARRVAENVGQLLIEAIVKVERGGNRPSFSIPSDLQQQWGLNWTS
jgi:hypothetical protein